jgi:hypothetical protein
VTRTFRKNDGQPHIRGDGFRRDPRDLRRHSRALIELARARAEQEAIAEADTRSQAKRKSKPKRPGNRTSEPFEEEHR